MVFKKIHLPSWSCFFKKDPWKKLGKVRHKLRKNKKTPPHHINLAEKSIISSSIFIDFELVVEPTIPSEKNRHASQIASFSQASG